MLIAGTVCLKSPDVFTGWGYLRCAKYRINLYYSVGSKPGVSFSNSRRTTLQVEIIATHVIGAVEIDRCDKG